MLVPLTSRPTGVVMELALSKAWRPERGKYLFGAAGVRGACEKIRELRIRKYHRKDEPRFINHKTIVLEALLIFSAFGPNNK